MMHTTVTMVRPKVMRILAFVDRKNSTSHHHDLLELVHQRR